MSRRVTIVGIVGALVVALALILATQPSPSASPLPASPTATLVLTTPSLTPAVSGQVVTCGTVTGYASDGAHLLLTLSVAGVQTQYNLQYQFEAVPPPSDIGDRFASHTPQLLRVSGRQVAPDSGSPNAITLRDWTVTRVDSCP